MLANAKGAAERVDVALEPTVSAPNLLVAGSDETFRAFVHEMLAFAARLEEVRNRFGRLIGLTGAQYTILISIAHLQGVQGVGINAVARHLRLSGAFVTIEVNRLVTDGLVTKAVNPSDRRRVLLRLTEKGRARLARLSPTQVRANDLIFGSLGRSDFLVLQRKIGELVEGGDAALGLLEGLETQPERG
ncbi:MarR family winged helix-turn-helix transcriptional regulator [Faunimonas sp. B44]|uniref:MarR family winged helix-turn-helix transcriptional regulator n=1 Tax=Faunimonas sp. B44 TaxID=3461493 RepID=UPI004043CCA3